MIFLIFGKITSTNDLCYLDLYISYDTTQDNEQWTQLLVTVEVSVDHFYIKC